MLRSFKLRWWLVTLAITFPHSASPATEPPVRPAAYRNPNVENPISACAARTPTDAIVAIAEIAPTIERIRVANRVAYVPNSGPVELMLFKEFLPKPGSFKQTNYRVVVMEIAEADRLSTSQNVKASNKIQARLQQIIPATSIVALPATTGENATDFLKDESTDPKTIVKFNTNLGKSSGLGYPRARVYVLGCGGANGDEPAFFGTLDTRISNRSTSLSFAVLACLMAYCLAALATFSLRRLQRLATTGTGTNYATVTRHFDPVVLTAGANGRGSPAKLQILFFSLLVLGLVFYIWMLTGRLTEISETVLLLMGISGAAATAAAGAEVSKNRLGFQNWAWLIERKWLPPGGVAEENMAQWKDIVTTDGEFDVYRFQMVTFSVLVGLALISAGGHTRDLGGFDIPHGLLAILGLSQVVYLAGKLVAPPAIKDLDKQIEALRAAEKNLQDKLDQSGARSLGDTVFLLNDDEKVVAARIAYSDYLQAWQLTRTMFESTLGRLVPKHAEKSRPPFPVPHIVCAKGNLSNGTQNRAYATTFSVIGGTSPYVWRISSGRLPSGMTLSESGVLSGAPTENGTFTFGFQVADAANRSTTEDFTLHIDP